MSKMKKTYLVAYQQSTDLVLQLIQSLDFINGELLSSEFLKHAKGQEIASLTNLINRNNRIIEKLKEEVP